VKAFRLAPALSAAVLLAACATEPQVLDSAPPPSPRLSISESPVVAYRARGEAVIASAPIPLGSEAACALIRGKAIYGEGLGPTELLSVAVDQDRFIVNGRQMGKDELLFFCDSGFDYGKAGKAQAVSIRKDRSGYSAVFLRSLPAAGLDAGNAALPSEGLPETPVLRILVADQKPELVGLLKSKVIEPDGSLGDEYASVAKDGELLVVNGRVVPEGRARFYSIEPIAFQGLSYSGVLTLGVSSGLAWCLDTLDLETYLKGVLPHEMYPEWNVEALKAQSVVARTYALRSTQVARKAGKSYDLFADVRSQAFGGDSWRESRTDDAVDGTRGLVLSYKGKYAEAFFHSNSGGVLEPGTYLLSHSVDYLVAMKDPYQDPGDSYSNWTATWPLSALSEALGLKDVVITGVKIATTTDQGRVLRIAVTYNKGGVVQKTSIRTVNFRTKVEGLYSELFTVSILGSNVVFTGSGFGHGVGMPQRSAKVMADKGFKYTDILNTYYPGTEVVSLEKAR